MATLNERYGWQWDDGERERRKGVVRQVQRQVDKLAEQVRRIQVHAPAFADTAAHTLRVITGSLGPLLSLNLTNRGPKYQAISPSDADLLLEAAPGFFRLWQAFASAPEFVAAVRSTNKDIRRSNAESRQLKAEYDQVLSAAFERLRPVYEMLDRGEHEAALTYAAKNGLLSPHQPPDAT